MALGRMQRECTYSVDNAQFGSRVMPEVLKSIEGTLYPLAQGRGLQLQRKEKVVTTGHGHPVGMLFNYTWRARKGIAPGFTVELKHHPKNYFHVTVKTRPHYPLAFLVSIALGVLLSYLWVPFLIANWSGLASNPLFLLGIVTMWVLFVFITRTIFISGLLAVLSSAAFGFIAGYGVGWLIALSASSGERGAAVRKGLASVLDSLNVPVGPVATTVPYYPPAGAIQYATAMPPPNAPSSFASAPYTPRPRAVASHPVAASAISVAACPQCRGAVAVGASNCPSCGLTLQWS